MLPVDSILPDVLASLRREPNLLIEAAPGAGKTTRIPPALLVLGGQVLVLEPRRIAARMAARRVAGELGEAVGETVGYQVRFEEVAGPKTRLRFLTEGVFTRRLVSDPELRGVGTVVLDEFHERHLETDLALALLRRLQMTKRPDLRIVVMSATLDSEPVRAFLGDCPALVSEGRLFDVSIEHLPYSAAALEDQVAGAVERVYLRGDVLVFLPGTAEIRRAQRTCEAFAAKTGLVVTPLYGDLSPAEQDRAVEPSSQRKIILATNIAESSITIEGVRAVVDAGTARVASDSPWTGLPSLSVQRISKASAKQRAGRAGRTGPGAVVRLYTAEDFHRRPEHDQPEILRRELSQLCLQLEAMGIANPLDLEWLDPPPVPALEAAETLLDRLHARGDAARSLARFPLHPRLARLLADADSIEGCRAGAILSSGQRVNSPDLLRAIDEEFDGRSRSTFDQLKRIARPSGRGIGLGQAVLAAFPDRVGRRRPGGVVLLSNGRSATMKFPPSEFFVAVDVEERNDRPTPEIRLACPIDPDWLLDGMTERAGVEWSKQGERVEAVSALLYDRLVIDENRGAMPDPEAAAALLATKAIEAGIERFVDAEEWSELQARVEFASQHSAIHPLTETDLQGALAELCYGLRSFNDLRGVREQVLPALERKLDARLLEEVAPTKLKLPGGRTAKIRYETGKPPWVASRLQDFFGMQESPRVARGQVALVVHLLAPNQRAVQTTTDLAGFWVRLYPQVRKELSRRYPRHAWPETV